MRKNNKIIVTVFALIFVFMILIPKVQAKTINELTAIESDGKISVSGTAESGTLAVAIMVYDSTGNNLITMQTTSVGSNNNYSDIITIASGTYVVKVADYDGGEYKSVTVSPKEENNQQTDKTEQEDNETNTKNEEKDTKTETSSNPTTGDNIILFIVLFAIATLGTVITIKLNKNRKVRKH